MFNVGPLELLVVLIIALIVLGPQRLPEVARSVGRGMREFRAALDREGEEDDEDGVEYEEPPAIEEHDGSGDGDARDEPAAATAPAPPERPAADA